MWRSMLMVVMDKLNSSGWVPVLAADFTSRESRADHSAASGTSGGGKSNTSSVSPELFQECTWVVFLRNITLLAINKKTTWQITFSSLYTTLLCDDWQSQSAKVLTQPWEWTGSDDSNNSPQPMCEYQMRFVDLDKPFKIHSKGKLTSRNLHIYRLWGFMELSSFMLSWQGPKTFADWD